MKRKTGYAIEAICEECGDLLASGLQPRDIVPECDDCEKKAEEAEKVWPTRAEPLAIYGAPGNWPVVPREDIAA